MAKKKTIDEDLELARQDELGLQDLIPVDPSMLIQATFHEETGEQVAASIGKDGKEYPDPVPIAPPLNYTPPPDLMTMIRTMVQSERLRHELLQQGFETEEEADDFDIEDDPIDPLTPYERHFLPLEQSGGPSPPAPPPTAQTAPTGTDKQSAGVSSPPPTTPQPTVPADPPKTGTSSS